MEFNREYVLTGLKVQAFLLAFIYIPYWIDILRFSPSLSNIVHAARRLLPLLVFGASVNVIASTVLSYMSLLGSGLAASFLIFKILTVGPIFQYDPSSIWFYDVALEYVAFYLLVFLITNYRTRDLRFTLNYSVLSLASVSWLYEIPAWFNWSMLYHISHPYLLNTQVVSTILLALIILDHGFDHRYLMLRTSVGWYACFSALYFVIGNGVIPRLLVRTPIMFVFIYLADSLRMK